VTLLQASIIALHYFRLISLWDSLRVNATAYLLRVNVTVLRYCRVMLLYGAVAG